MGRVAVVHPYWDFWAGSTPFELEESREGLLDRALGHIERHATIVWSGLVDADRVPGAIEEIGRTDPDVLVVLQSMATPPAVTTRLLDQFATLPLVVWTLRDAGAVDAGFDHSDVTAEGATVGTPMLTSILVRSGRPFDLLTRPMTDPRVDEDLGACLRAAVAASQLARARIGRVGAPIDGYSSVDLQPSRLTDAVGPTLIDIGPDEYLDTFLAVAKNDVHEEGHALLESYRVAPGIRTEEVDTAVRCAIALERLVAAHDLDAGAFNCHVPQIRLGTDIGIAPCFALGCSTSSGVPWTCSGDVVTAVAMLAMKALGAGAFYHELEAFDSDSGVFVLANSGEHDVSLAAADTPLDLVVNPWYPADVRSLCARISPSEGPATLVAFAQLDQPDSHRFIVAPGRFIEPGFPATGTSNAAFVFTGSDAADSWRRWCLAGANHHGVATTGDLVAPLQRLANHLGTDVIVI